MQVQGFHAVTPKRDCPHCTPENIAPKEEFVGIHVNDKCGMCDNRGENWLCLKPGNPKVYCSRYVNNHMLNFYFENPDHPIVFSFADFSFWCYVCDSYIEHPLLDHTRAFYL
jgi:histone deacetylase 6